jgi:hypothetical protein
MANLHSADAATTDLIPFVGGVETKTPFLSVPCPFPSGRVFVLFTGLLSVAAHALSESYVMSGPRNDATETFLEAITLEVQSPTAGQPRLAFGAAMEYVYQEDGRGYGIGLNNSVLGQNGALVNPSMLVLVFS